MKHVSLSALFGAGALLLIAQPASAAPDTAPIYKVTQEGLSADQGAKLADSFGIPNVLQANGAFSYAERRVRPGSAPPGRRGEGRVRPAHPDAGDRHPRSRSDQAAERRRGARAGPGSSIDLVGLSPDFRADPSVSHAKLTLSDRAGRPTSETALDTAVSFKFELGGLPVSGQGAKLRVTFAGDGSVTQLSDSLRGLERSDDVPIISPDEAQKACSALYDTGVRQGEPTLGYLLPALGAVEAIYPHYTCNPSTDEGNQAHRQVPAVDGAAPQVTVKAARSGAKILASADASGGTGPYTFRWSSSTTTLDDNDGSAIAYERSPRGRATAGEDVTLEVTDVNGLTSTASVSLPGDGTVEGGGVPGGGGFGKLAIGPVDVGIEQTVDEWQCAQDSAIGFKAQMAARGIPTAFDWRGWAAFEKDFKDFTKGGWDRSYVDNVDAQWYTGHGSPGSFTFKGSSRRQVDHAGRRDLGRLGPRVDAAGVLPGAERHQRLARLLQPLGRDDRRPAHAERLPHERVLRRRRHRRHVRRLPVPRLVARSADRPQRVGADGARQASRPASCTARWATSAPAGSPTSATTSGARARPGRTSASATGSGCGRSPEPSKARLPSRASRTGVHEAPVR